MGLSVVQVNLDSIDPILIEDFDGSVVDLNKQLCLYTAVHPMSLSESIRSILNF